MGKATKENIEDNGDKVKIRKKSYSKLVLFKHQ